MHVMSAHPGFAVDEAVGLFCVVLKAPCDVCCMVPSVHIIHSTFCFVFLLFVFLRWSYLAQVGLELLIFLFHLLTAGLTGM